MAKQTAGQSQIRALSGVLYELQRIVEITDEFVAQGGSIVASTLRWSFKAVEGTVSRSLDLFIDDGVEKVAYEIKSSLMTRDSVRNLLDQLLAFKVARNPDRLVVGVVDDATENFVRDRLDELATSLGAVAEEIAEELEFSVIESIWNVDFLRNNVFHG